MDITPALSLQEWENVKSSWNRATGIRQLTLAEQSFLEQPVTFLTAFLSQRLIV